MRDRAYTFHHHIVYVSRLGCKMSVLPTVSYNGSNESEINKISETDKNPKTAQGSVMSFHEISYVVEIKQSCCGICRKKTKKKILNDVSGIIKPGINAIMGPTGSGKSSLLDALARRKDPAFLKGQILLDGKPLPKNFQYISGYVIQNDLMLGTISVRETLWFCANLRLPPSISHQDKKRRIENVIDELGLKSCADTKIGTEIIRGISGGEKKRTSIALELILEPKILFLDEPTTGLDAATAWSVMLLLKTLAKKGNTIVCSIHQPRYSIFKLFDTLTLLSQGNVVYHGPTSDALPHFESVGYSCEPHDNPADFFLDVLNGTHHISSDEIEVTSAVDEEQGARTPSNIANSLVTAFISSEKFNTLTRELNEYAGSTNKIKVKHSGSMYATSFTHQLGVLLKRAAKNAIRDPQGLIGNIVLNIIIGVVFGLIYYQVDNSPDSGIQNRLGILFFICTNLLFGSIAAIDAFKIEREIFIHEHVSGYYRVISYYLAKVLADLIPLRTIAPTIFCAITYWMVGLKPTAGSFFLFVLLATLVGYSSIGIGLFYSATFTKAVAELLLILTFVFTVMFSGLLVNVDTILPWLSWLKYLSIARYGLVGLSVNELWGQNFTSCSANLTTFQSSIFASSDVVEISRPDNETVCISIQGDEYLHSSLSIGASGSEINSWDLWQNVVALACIATGLYTLTYIQLTRIKTYS
uniref:broad substrate specificity ATP-binding cassette transporter ABCG2-like n=1 Tax=Styela clava TaxID=7725 RepID=UPI00193A99D3|nr:broad substrate specificity ATP-binding cassette transporter ABCG2-like [Styela clava]